MFYYFESWLVCYIKDSTPELRAWKKISPFCSGERYDTWNPCPFTNTLIKWVFTKPENVPWHFLECHLQIVFKIIKIQHKTHFFKEMITIKFLTWSFWDMKLFIRSISEYLLSQSCTLVCACFVAFILFMYLISCKSAENLFFLKEKLYSCFFLFVW